MRPRQRGRCRLTNWRVIPRAGAAVVPVMRAILTLCVLVPLYSCSSPQSISEQGNTPTLIRADKSTAWDSIIAAIVRTDGGRLDVQSVEGTVYWRFDSRRCDTPAELQEALRDFSGALHIHTGPSITYADVARTLDIVTAAGVTEITFAANQRNE